VTLTSKNCAGVGTTAIEWRQEISRTPGERAGRTVQVGSSPTAGPAGYGYLRDERVTSEQDWQSCGSLQPLVPEGLSEPSCLRRARARTKSGRTAPRETSCSCSMARASRRGRRIAPWASYAPGLTDAYRVGPRLGVGGRLHVTPASPARPRNRLDRRLRVALGVDELVGRRQCPQGTRLHRSVSTRRLAAGAVASQLTGRPTAVPSPPTTLEREAGRHSQPTPSRSRSKPCGSAPRTVARVAAPACDPSYPTVCIPPFPPDLDCAEVPYSRFARSALTRAPSASGRGRKPRPAS
jgi:hypothetical protein